MSLRDSLKQAGGLYSEKTGKLVRFLLPKVQAPTQPQRVANSTKIWDSVGYKWASSTSKTACKVLLVAFKGNRQKQGTSAFYIFKRYLKKEINSEAKYSTMWLFLQVVEDYAKLSQSKSVRRQKQWKCYAGNKQKGAFLPIQLKSSWKFTSLNASKCFPISLITEQHVNPLLQLDPQTVSMPHCRTYYQTQRIWIPLAPEMLAGSKSLLGQRRSSRLPETC